MRELWVDIEKAAEGQHGVIARWQLNDMGLHEAARRRAITARRLVVVLPGAYSLPGTPDTWHRAASASVLDAGRNALLSHRSAAALHDFDGFSRKSDEKFEVVIRRGTSTREREYRLHLTNLAHAEEDQTAVDGVACTTTVRTVIDLAGTMSASSWRLERLVDMSIRDGHCSEAELRARLATWRHHGTAGAQVLDSVLGGEDLARTDSEAERRFLKLVREEQLPEPELQFVVRNGNRFVGRVDFCWPDARLVVEIDGHRFHSTRDQRRHDASRRRAISALGYEVWVYEATEVFRDEGQIGAAIRPRTKLVAKSAGS